MTVGSLIKKLQQFNQNLSIYFVTNDGEFEYSICEIDEYARGVYIDLEEE